MLNDITNKIQSNDRLTVAEGIWLFENVDLLALGKLANYKREKLHGCQTYYVRNLHIDYSNVCSFNCKFCAYSKKKGEVHAFELSVDDVLAKIEPHADDISQVHIVGGHHPALPFDYYLSLIQKIKNNFPHIHIKAFTAMEICYFANKFNLSTKDVLKQFIAVGLDSLPGGGAEILVDSVREKICKPKGKSDVWLQTHAMAHSLGLKTTATMLFGHVESIEDRVIHLEKIRVLQDQTKGFTTFVPLSFHPQNTEFKNLSQTTAHDILKTISVARLFLDNVSHIKAYWVMLGLSLAQIAQDFGADDFHGTVIQENITHMAGGKSPQGCSVAEIKKYITEAGWEPVELYH